MVKKLIGEDTKKWVYIRMEKYLGEEARCKQGQTYLFKKDGSLVIERCIEGVVYRDNFS